MCVCVCVSMFTGEISERMIKSLRLIALICGGFPVTCRPHTFDAWIRVHAPKTLCGGTNRHKSAATADRKSGPGQFVISL